MSRDKTALATMLHDNMTPMLHDACVSTLGAIDGADAGALVRVT
jgi:hypothetical protein